jgi:hypothetical protein
MFRYARKLLKEAEFPTGNPGFAAEPAKAVNAVLMAKACLGRLQKSE